MRTVRSLLMATALVTMLAIPAMAQHDGEEDTVTKTFELTLNGDVPQGHGFSVNFHLDDDPSGEGGIAFCGSTGSPAEPGIEPCEGDGTVYSAKVELDRGTTIAFTYLSLPGGDEPDRPFNVGTETLDADMTTSTEYTFFGDGERDDKQGGARDGTRGKTPAEMPDSGSGGLAAGATIPVGNAAAGLTMLVGAGYAVLRRR